MLLSFSGKIRDAFYMVELVRFFGACNVDVLRALVTCALAQVVY